MNPPHPSPEAQAHSLALVARIRQAIAEHGGRLPFDRYMELALYAPGLGYYMAGARKFGADGDFVTAPEISPLFGRALARQVQQVLADLGGGDVLEFGAGSGRLALDLLGELETLEALPGRYGILELSPDLRQRQQALLAEQGPHLLGRVAWLEGLPEGFRGVMLANEVLDAMPVQRFRKMGEGIEEQFVVAAGEGLGLVWGPPVSAGLAEAVAELERSIGAPFADGYESEINPRLGPWLRGLSAALVQGLVLLIDYGYPRREYYLPERYRGTLMAHYRHLAHGDPLSYPGLQDLTAHVDFTAVAAAGGAAGLEAAGYTTQANFLLGCGLDQLLAEADPGDLDRYLDLLQGMKRLVLPSAMGERFQVIAFRRGLDRPLLGFGLRDRTLALG
jgi:SAM-dependent MidA family methyltransferase